MKTGLITSDAYKGHDTGPGHPEQIARVTVINENLKKINNKNILWKKPSIITDEIIKDGWLYTGDIGVIKNGFLYLKLKTFIKILTLFIFWSISVSIGAVPSPIKQILPSAALNTWLSWESKYLSGSRKNHSVNNDRKKKNTH